MLATLVSEPFDRPGWVYEEKYDGVRVIAYRRGKHTRLLSRNFKEVTANFPEIAMAIENLSHGNLVLDGEVVAFDRDGVSRFQLLQRREMGERVALVYAVFDCLEREDRTLLKRPLHERRRVLELIVPKRSNALMWARRLAGSGLEAYETAARNGWEGIVGKDDGSIYEPGRRSRSWLKVKCRKQSEFVIGGFTEPKGLRRDFGAILIGLYQGNRLRYTGKVGTGFSRAMLADLGAKMRALRTKVAPFEPAPRETEVTWLLPKLVAEIAFAEWTQDGKLRQPVFLGLRDDKNPEECTWSGREK
jgi:bifunctional non-homologous end joining protein LigD